LNLFYRDISFSNEIILDKPIELVFNFLVDFQNMPKWNYYVLSVVKTSPGPVKIGTTFHQTRKRDEQNYTITELVYPSTIVVESIVLRHKFRMRFELTSMDKSTKLIDTWEVRAPFFVAFFINRPAKEAVAANLEKLKILLENGKVVLQDGRSITIE
jgi:hypothetical protein